MTTILLAGFGAFPGAPVNPTTALVARLARAARRRGLRCIPHVFATRYAAVGLAGAPGNGLKPVIRMVVMPCLVPRFRSS